MPPEMTSRTRRSTGFGLARTARMRLRVLRAACRLAGRRIRRTFRQQQPDLLLHRAAIARRAQPQPLFHLFAQVADRQGAHAGRLACDCIAINAIKTARLPRPASTRFSGNSAWMSLGSLSYSPRIWSSTSSRPTAAIERNRAWHRAGPFPEAAPGDVQTHVRAERAHDALQLAHRGYVHRVFRGLDLNRQPGRLETELPAARQDIDAAVAPGAVLSVTKPCAGWLR